MDNVVKFAPRKVEVEEDHIASFLTHSLFPWAVERGVDINSMRFKLNAATIMTCLQGMLLDDI